MTGFIVSVFPSRNRVSSQEAFEGLELGEGKPSRPVLRGPGGRKAVWLLGSYYESDYNGGSLNPSLATCSGRTRAPASPIAVATRLAAPFSTRKITQPPPPAPHTLAALPPCLPATVISLSIKVVVIPGALLRRNFHSSRNNRPTPSQSLATNA